MDAIEFMKLVFFFFELIYYFKSESIFLVSFNDWFNWRP